MARISLRTVANKTGYTYVAGNTTFFYAEDYEKIKDAIQDASAGINTEQVEVGGTTKINSSGDIVNMSSISNSGDVVTLGDLSGTKIVIDNSSNKLELYVNGSKVKEWS